MFPLLRTQFPTVGRTAIHSEGDNEQDLREPFGRKRTRGSSEEAMSATTYAL